MKTEAKLSW